MKPSVHIHRSHAYHYGIYYLVAALLALPFLIGFMACWSWIVFVN